jgi:hypothetical protein
MPALSQDRNTPMRLGEIKEDPVAAATRIFTGALIMRNAAGFLTCGATAPCCIGVGRADEGADNTAGAAGAITAPFRTGVFRFANMGGDAVLQAGVGKLCYIVDDQTVAATGATNTRSPAGIVDGIDAGGVWVRLDEAVTRAAL